MRALLPGLLPALLEQTKVQPELVRIQDLGPFKITVDDGLDCRKARALAPHTYIYVYTLPPRTARVPPAASTAARRARWRHTRVYIPSPRAPRDCHPPHAAPHVEGGSVPSQATACGLAAALRGP